MAFKMNRPLIKGTPIHKASIAKAKAESIVSQARTKSDAGLVQSGRLLGESYMPGDIDFSIDIAKPNLTKKDLKDALGKKSKKTKNNRKVKNDVPEIANETNYGDSYAWRFKPRRKNTDNTDDKKVENKKDDVLIGNTESANSKYVAPYVVEADDEDEFNINDLDDENEGGDEGGNGEFVYKPYENFKVREEKRLLKEAEELKARSDAKSRARSLKVPQIEMIDIDQIPLPPLPEPKLEQATGPAPESKRKPAHLDPNLNNEINTDIEGTGNLQTPRLNPHDQYAANLPEDAEDHFTGSYNDYAYTTVMTDIDGDGVLDKQEVWTYKGDVINENQVSTEAYASITSDLDDKQEQEYNEEIEQEKEDLNSNTPSNDSTTVDLLPQPPTNTTVSTNTKQTLTPREVREKKRADKKYNDPSTGPNVKEQMIKEGYVPNESKSAAQMRDDRVYRNAKPNGPVRKNMIQGGYTPQ